MRSTLTAAALALALSCGFAQDAAAPKAPGQADKKLKLAVIPKGSTHVFWKSVHAGAAKAAQEEGVEIVWKGPQREDDRAQQIEVVQNFISLGVDGIVLAPLDSNALVRPVQTAVKKGIKVIIIDSDLKADSYTSFVATDNYAGGKLGAKRLAGLLPGGKGSVLMLRYLVGSASTENRERGFLDGMKEYAPQATIVSADQFGGATPAECQKVAQNLLNKYGQLDGVYASNDPTTYGLMRALQGAGRAGKVKFVGFDASESTITAMRGGEIQGLSVQNPFNMGYLGVKTAVAALKGQKVEKRLDTGVVMVTPENLDTPDVQALLNPDLKKFLGE